MSISRTKILIVEDQAVIAMSIEDNLTAMGFQIIDIVDRGENVLSSIKKHSPDLILMDIFLKGKMTGIEAAEEFKKKFDIPLIFLTASSDHRTVENARKIQADAYLIKPFNEQSLKISIDMALDRHQLLQKYKKSNLLLEKTLQIARTGHWQLDLTNNSFSWNKELFDLLDLNPDEVKASNKGFLKAIHPEDRRYLLDSFKNALNSSETFEVENRILTSSGEVKYVRQTCETIYHKSGKPLRSIGIVQDITEQRLPQQAFKNFDEKNAGGTLGNRDIIIKTDKAGKLKAYNNEAMTLLGYAGKGLEEKNIYDFIHPGDRNKYARFQERLIKNGRAENPKGRIIDKNGRFRYIHVLAEAIYNNQGEFKGSKEIIRDITTSVEEILRQNLISYVVSAIQSCASINELGKSIQRELKKVLPFDDLIIATYDFEKKASVLYPSGSKYTQPPVNCLAVQIIKHKTPFTLNGKELSEFMLSNSLIFVGNKGESVAGVPFTIKDTPAALLVKSKTNRNYTPQDLNLLKIIAEQLALFMLNLKNVESAKVARSIYDDFLSQFQGGVWRMEIENPINLGQKSQTIEHQILHDVTITYCNRTMAKMYGYNKPEEMFNTRMIDMFSISSRDDRLEVSHYIQNFIRNGFKFEDTISKEINKDGEVIYFSNNAFGVVEENQLVRLWGIQTDVTEKLKEQEKIKQSEAKFSTIFQNSSDEIYVVEPDSMKIIEVNSETCKKLGYTRSELLELSIFDISPIKELYKNNLIKIANIFKQGEVRFIGVNKRKDGLFYDLEVRVKAIEYAGEKYMLATGRQVNKKHLRNVELLNLENVIFNAGDAVLSTDKKGVITSCNKAALDLFKYKPEGIIGNAIQIFLPDYLEEEHTELFIEIASQQIYDQQGIIIERGGNTIQVQYKIIPAIDKAGKLKGNFFLIKEASELINSNEYVKELQAFADINPHIVMRCDENYYINYTNKPASDINISISEQSGLLRYWFIELYQESINKSDNQGEFECMINDKWYRFFAKKQESSNDIVFFGVDISELKISQNKHMKLVINLEKLVKERTHSLELSHKYLTVVAGNANIILFQVSADKKFTMVQGVGASTLFDHSNNMVGKPIDSISQNQPAIVSYIEKSLLGEQMKHIVSKQDSYYEITYIPNISKLDTKNSMFGLAVDITEIVKSQKKYIESQKQYRHIVESSSETIFLLNDKNNFTYINNAGVKLTGYPINELIGKNIYSLIRPDFAEKVEEFYKQKIKNKSREIILEYPIINKREEERWVKQSVRIIYMKKQISKVRSFQGVIHDITAEKKAQFGMEAANQKMNELQDAINSATLITHTDLDGVILDVNQKLCDISGYTHKELLGSNQNILDSGYHDKKFYANMWKTLKKGQIWRGEIRNRAKNGELFWVDTVMSPQSNRAKKPYAFLCFGIDITFRKTVEIQLRESELRFRELFEDTNDLIQGIDIDGKILFVNDSWENVLGYKLKDVEDLNFWNIVDKESINKWKAHWQTVTQTVNENDPVEIELITKKGNSISIAGNSISSFTDGRLIIRSIFHDITPRKEAEKEILKSLKKEKELGELKSKFVATVSHQFRTPLTIILSNIELLDMLYRKDKQVATVSYNRISKRIQDEVKRMTNLMNDVLILGKVSAGKFELRKTSVDLIKLCKNLKQQYDQIQDDGRKLELQVVGKNKKIEIDSSLIIHAISNLIANAFKYSKGCKNPEFVVKFENKKIVILVTDYGIGIKKPDIPFIFDAFFRTTDTKNITGSGLGLNIAKEYIEIDKGKITVESKFGHGSIFRVELPY